MAWHETWNLTQELVRDPTSHVAASIAEWVHPISHESMVLRDLYDLLAHVNSGRRKPKPYPRPWDPKPKRMGSTGGRNREQVLALLRSRGHGVRPPLRRDRNGRLHGAQGRFVTG